LPYLTILNSAEYEQVIYALPVCLNKFRILTLANLLI